MIAGQMNQHPRSAMALRESDKKNDFIKFYDEMTGQ
jgi:4-hydroxy 2-oxovalerate aldolase